MALLRVMTGGWLGYAAMEDRIRPALKDHAATGPDHRGQRLHQPTARGVLPDVVGMHV